MAFYGIDISEWQDGLSLKKAEAEGMSFVIIRTGDGTYRDRCFHSHLADADGTSMKKAVYHYMHKDIRGSISTCLSMLGGRKDLPVWLDFEAPGERFTASDIRLAKELLAAAGVRCAGIYSYVPFWEGLGDPALPPGLFVWVAAYPVNSPATPARRYASLGGREHRQWQHPLSNKKPVMWQFTSAGCVAGFQLDCNAFEGTHAELEALFSHGGKKMTAPKHLSPDYQRLAFEQLAGPGRTPQGKPDFKGWTQLGGHTVVDALAVIGQTLGIPGFGLG